jgi:hypothetical protein
MLVHLFNKMTQWGVLAPETMPEETLRETLLDLMKNKPDLVKDIESLYSLANLRSSLSLLLDDAPQIRRFLDFVKATCPFMEELPSLSAAAKVALGHGYMRTVKGIVPHARTHIPRMNEESLSKSMEILAALANLKADCTLEDLRAALAASGLPVPVAESVTPSAPFMRIGDTNLGVVIPGMLQEAVPMQMVSDVAMEDAVIGVRHGGKQIMPFLRRDAEKAGRFTPNTTTSLVVTGWIDAQGKEGFQAGTLYPGEYLPGRDPLGTHDVFFKYFKTDEALQEAARRFVDVPGGKISALTW